MKKVLFLVYPMLMGFILLSPTKFVTKPIQVCSNWIESNQSFENILLELSQDFSVQSKTDNRLTLESLPDRTSCKIWIRSDQNGINGIRFSKSTAGYNALLKELKKLKFVEKIQSNSEKSSFQILVSKKKKLTAVIIKLEASGVVDCSLYKGIIANPCWAPD